MLKKFNTREYWHRLRVDLGKFSRFVWQRFNQERCTQIAASLTFTTLLSLVPLVTIALTLFAAFPVFEDFSAHIKTYLMNNLMPNKASGIITQYVEQFTQNATHLTTIGVAFLGVTAMFMMVTIEHAFNTIWRVTHPRPVVKRLIIYWALLTLGPLLIGASLSVTSWVVGISLGYTRHIPLIGSEILKIMPIALTTVAFALLFRVMPHRHVEMKSALVGAVVAALAFETMNRIFAYYISHFTTYKLVYGAFSSIPIFLMWIYLSWLVILLGAVITSSFSHWRMHETPNITPTERVLSALRLLRILSHGLHDGKISIFTDLSKQVRLDYDTLEAILKQLADAKMICKTGRNGWILLRDPSQIKTSEVLHLFVLDSKFVHIGQKNDTLQQWLAQYANNIEQQTALSLAELFQHCNPEKSS